MKKFLTMQDREPAPDAISIPAVPFDHLDAAVESAKGYSETLVRDYSDETRVGIYQLVGYVDSKLTSSFRKVRK